MSEQTDNLEINIIEVTGSLPDAQIVDLIKRLKRDNRMPVIALVPVERLDSLDSNLDIDDFITSPYDARELTVRINRLLHSTGIAKSNQIIECEGLVLDPATCEVAVDGMVVALTFKEYELLKLLAGHRGRVFTREALLNKVWGDDYYGGDRTVDVHVRRLRSKIEDAKHSYIETVRNIGYRFRKEL